MRSEMCVPLLGAVSSPSSSNYALKRTAVDNSNYYGLHASEPVMKNFYVDDLLKSVESEECGVDLIKKVKKMWTASALSLTKFICNRKNVLMSIPDIHRREVIKHTDLVKKELFTERISQVYWNVEKGEPEKETKKLERFVIYVEFLLRSSRFSLKARFSLKGRLILQELCQERLHWDKQVSEEYVKKKKAWKRELYEFGDVFGEVY